MNQDTANALFSKGGFLLFLDAPDHLQLGIDCTMWTTGPRFKGLKLIPPGVHLIHYNLLDPEHQGGVGGEGLVSGSFHHFAPGQILVWRWDVQTEAVVDVAIEDPDQASRYRLGKLDCGGMRIH